MLQATRGTLRGRGRIAMTELRGAELVRAVIEKVRASSFADVFGAEHVRADHQAVPVPADVLERVRLDGDVPLTPCLKAWLAFDGAWFGWIDRRGEMRGKTVGKLTEHALEHVGLMFEVLESTLPRQGYLLPGGNMENAFFLYPGATDATGELPILVAESENQRIGVAYPGLDLFLGERAGLLGNDWRARERDRLVAHKVKTLGGRPALELGEEDAEGGPSPEPDQPANLTKVGSGQYALIGDGPVPEGYVVLQDAQNPFTKERMRLLTRA